MYVDVRENYLAGKGWTNRSRQMYTRVGYGLIEPQVMISLGWLDAGCSRTRSA